MTKLVNTIEVALEDLKAIDIQIMDVKLLTSITDHMIITTGTSSRHINAMADKVIERVNQQLDVKPLGVEGQQEAEWILLDFGDALVHIMLPDIRALYALEKLWHPAAK